MKRDEALRILSEHREELNAFGVERLGIFGSVARDEAGSESDVDVLVEFNEPAGLFEFMDLQERLEELFDRKVDLTTLESLKPQLREGILDGDTKHPRYWQLPLENILEAIERAERYVQGMDFEAFRADELTLYAVARNVSIIGESSRHIPPRIEERYPQVPWAMLRGLCEVIAYENFESNLPKLWKMITENLSPVVPMLQDILEREA
jgi:uncharacterized protein with HEPN domain/predicted nucleotidyltransferase